MVSSLQHGQNLTPLRFPLDGVYDDGNPFAQILRGERRASFVYQDDHSVVIMPLQWDHPGHALVVPRGRVLNLLEMTAAEMGRALVLAAKTGLAQKDALGATGFSVLQNNGRDQAVGHVHFHVIPNTPRTRRTAIPRLELDRMAERLAACFPAIPAQEAKTNDPS